MADNKSSDAEQRAAAILLPGKALELDDIEFPEEVDDNPPEVIRINGKLYVKDSGEPYTLDSEEKATTGSPSLDTMLEVVGQSIARTNAEMEEVAKRYQLPTASRALAERVGKKKAKRKQQSKQVTLLNQSNGDVAVDTGSKLTVVSSGGFVRVDPSVAFADRNERLLASGVLKLVQEDDSEDSRLPSITVAEFEQLRRLELKGRQTDKWAPQEEFFCFVDALCSKYDLDPDEFSIDLSTGEFYSLEEDDGWR